MEDHNVCEVTSNNLKLAALILCVTTLVCGTYLTGKYIDYKVSSNEQTTKRVISFDQRCLTSPESCKNSK